MRIGIDISQLAYPNTGVANYLKNLVEKIIQEDTKNEYILFFSTLRGKVPTFSFGPRSSSNEVVLKSFKYPPSVLNLLWNKLHIFPIENLIGNVDIFITSDWTEPPAKKAKKATILYDLIAYKYPEETHSKTEFNLNNLKLSANIVSIQKRKLHWVKKESDMVFCISESTKKDAEELLGISSNKLKVIYPGILW